MVEIARQQRKVTASELSARYGVSERTIRRLVAEERCEYLSRARKRRDQIIALHRQGLTQHAIADQLGITRQLVSLRIREARHDGTDLSPTTCNAELPATGT